MNTAVDVRSYSDNYEHLEDELRRIDLMLQLWIRKQTLQPQPPANAGPSRAVYIGQEEVEWLLKGNASPASEDTWCASARAELAALRSAIDSRITRSREDAVYLALPQLCALFGLSVFERDVVMLCLAPELRRKYDRLYAYVQDDIMRKRPSVDLILELLCDSEVERWRERKFLADGASLERSGIIQEIDDPHSPSGSSGLAQFLKLDPRICGFLLASNQIDTRLIDVVQILRPGGYTAPLPANPLPIDPAIVASISRLVEHHVEPENTSRRKLVLHWHGPQGLGERELALHLCRKLDCLTLRIDAELLLSHGRQAETLLRLAFREALLQQALVHIEHADALLQDSARPLLATLQTAVAEYGWLLFLSGETPWTQNSVFSSCVFHSTALSIPDVPIRATVWERLLSSETPEAADWATQLASQFRLTPRQIQSAVELARNHRHMEPGRTSITIADLTFACRQQSNHKLRELAVKIEPQCGWNDIVLPADKMAHLREICSHLRHRHRVFGEWGFGKKVSRGKGLSVLFTGPSGTGKTMAAEVLAADLELDLYKVDLSSLVSKYIGETEKNLSHVFAEAESSNAILFFDEADALFGKRTEVSDAHDRFANIETSYLLQKMEEYEGVVIMTTNLRENMDEAFARRIRFIVEFPFPDEAHRLRMWQTHFPTEAPVREEVDCRILARHLQVSGGSIRNIVLNSAFSAAEDGGRIGMEHILGAAKREFEKIGKLWNEKRTVPWVSAAEKAEEGNYVCVSK